MRFIWYKKKIEILDINSSNSWYQKINIYSFIKINFGYKNYGAPLQYFRVLPATVTFWYQKYFFSDSFLMFFGLSHISKIRISDIKKSFCNKKNSDIRRYLKNWIFKMAVYLITCRPFILENQQLLHLTITNIWGYTSLHLYTIYILYLHLSYFCYIRDGLI